MKLPTVAVLLLVALGSNPAQACSCRHQSPRAARNAADLVFAGRVESVTYVDGKESYEPRIIVAFKVGRVWKGNVPAEFSMYTHHEHSACRGFFGELAQPGLELLVFAKAGPARDWKEQGQEPGAENSRSFTYLGGKKVPVLRPDLVADLADDAVIYSTDICSGTSMWQHADFAVRTYGGYSRPEGAYPLDDPPKFDDSLVPDELKTLPNVCWRMRMADSWKELGEPPVEAELFDKLMGEQPQYRAVMKSATGKPTDLWLRNEKGAIGLCRATRKDLLGCGGVVAVFDRWRNSGKDWGLSDFDGEPCDDP